MDFIKLFSDNTSGIIAAVLSMLFFGIADSFWKIPVRTLGPAKTIFFRNLLVVVLVGIFFIGGNTKNYFNSDAIKATLILSAISYLGLFFFAKAQGTGKISIVVPISNTNTLIPLLLSVVILEKTLNNIAIAGLIITILGLFLIKVQIFEQGTIVWKVIWETGTRFALLAALFWGLSYGFAYVAVAFTGVALFSIMLESIILLLSLGHTLMSGESLGFSDEEFKLNFKYIIVVGIFGALGTLFNTYALDNASINTVCGILTLAPFISIIIGRTVFKEQVLPQQKIGTFLIIAGIFVVAYFRNY